MTDQMKHKHQHGFYRWLVLALLILSLVVSVLIKPIQPAISVAPENLHEQPLISLPILGDLFITNSLVGILIADLIILLIAWRVNRALKRREAGILCGLGNMLIISFEAIFDFAERIAGKFIKTVFPWFATILVLTMIGNWIDLIPGVESFGLFLPEEGGSPIRPLIPGVISYFSASGTGEYHLASFMRSPSTDLNFTVALALIAVAAIQTVGLKHHGLAYLQKFFNVVNLFKKPFLGVMDLFVSILESIAEFSKIISFAFRLFGSSFAGLVLIILMGVLLPVLGQSAMMLFELFMGTIQALVFAMLTLIFMTMAIKGEEQHQQKQAAKE